MPWHAMHSMQDCFLLEGFRYAQQIDMHCICTSMLAKFYSCKMWVLQVGHQSLRIIHCRGSIYRMDQTQPTQVSTNHVRVHAAHNHELDCYNSFTLQRLYTFSMSHDHPC
jgi:hypothetical protein